MIREARKKDIERLFKLDKEASKEIKWWQTLTKAKLLKLLKQKNCLYVAEKNKKIIGFLRAQKKKEYIELEDLFVKKQFRRHGIAKKLVRFFINNCKKIGYREIKLVCPGRLRKFNESLGFRVTSLNMSKKLK